MSNNRIKFIDLFAGIGGFHQALNDITDVETECVFASEIDKFAIDVYKENYGIDSDNDITKINGDELMLQDYDMLCAGFPCQSFSKAGNQEGFNDPTKGTLFFDIKRLLEYRLVKGNPVKYIVLENVANLVKHDNGNTWRVITETLDKLGYISTIDPLIVSPHQLGVPHLRSRVFIVAIHNSYLDQSHLNINLNLQCKSIKRNNVTDWSNVIDFHLNYDGYNISSEKNFVLKAWSDFKKYIIKDNVLGYPIWLDSFNISDEEIEHLPEWKKVIIYKNKKLYLENKLLIDNWLYIYDMTTLPKSYRKFEWQAGVDIKSLEEGIIQFRPSGVRVKRPTEFPALVAMVHTPIICVAGKFRNLSIREVSKLQSFPDDFIICDNLNEAYKQFGNSVNVVVVREIVKELLKLGGDLKI